MTTMKHEKKHHPGRIALAGAIFGLAAGIFMSSREGKRMAARLRDRAKGIEARLRREFSKRKFTTQQAYEESIDSVLAYYLKSKEIAKAEIPQLRSYLMNKWTHVKEELASVKPSKKKNATKARS